VNVAEVLRANAEDFPRDAALIDARHGAARRMSFGELEHAAGRTAALLGQAGLQPGNVVLVFHPMSVELYVAVAAIFRLGLTAMFVDPSAGVRYIEECCGLCPPQALLATSKAHLLRLLAPSLRRIPLKFVSGVPVPGAVSLNRADRLPYDATIHVAHTQTPALISFTSGGTGRPKAALRTHGFLLAQHRAVERCLQLTPGEVELATLPIFVLANLASRVTSLLPDADLRRPDAVDAARIVAQICRHAPTRAAASPALLDRLADHCERRQMTLPSLRRIFTGGGPVPLRLLDRLQRIAPGAATTIIYGSTEAEPIAAVSQDQIGDAEGEAMAAGRGLLVGQPADGIDLRILEDRWGTPVASLEPREFERLCLPPQEVGEIVVRGEHVLPGYLHGVGDDENRLDVDGAVWRRTGDAGYLDGQGRLWLLGRCAARLQDDRGVLYPLGVEHAVLRNAWIRRAAVLSARGRRMLAVELRDEAARPDEASLQKLLTYAEVDAVRFVRRIPVDARHNAKVDYSALRTLLEKSA
jgi:acyl-CoA synthetase (AMP-forming)/AMP-acid ligase II